MKKIILFSIIGIYVILLQGCSSSKSSFTYYNPNKKSTLEEFTIPKLNEVNTIEIGLNMYKKMKRFEQNTYTVSLLEPIPKISTMATGKFGIDNPIELGLLKKEEENNWNVACTRKGNYHSYEVCLYDVDNDYKFDKAGATMNGLYTDLNKKIAYKIENTEPIYKEDSFKYEVLYQGKKGNTIKISFREFKDNVARPAFTQDIEYKLNKDGSTTIGFKGLRVNVIKATTFDITYKVIKDYE